MKIVNGYRVEKDCVLKKWVAWEKQGISGWSQAHSEETYKKIKDWCKKQSNKKGKKYERN